MVVAPLTSNFGRVAGKRFPVAAFPWRWEGADGYIVLLVAFLDMEKPENAGYGTAS